MTHRTMRDTSRYMRDTSRYMRDTSRCMRDTCEIPRDTLRTSAHAMWTEGVYLCMCMCMFMCMWTEGVWARKPHPSPSPSPNPHPKPKPKLRCAAHVCVRCAQRGFRHPLRRADTNHVATAALHGDQAGRVRAYPQVSILPTSYFLLATLLADLLTLHRFVETMSSERLRSYLRTYFLLTTYH